VIGSVLMAAGGLSELIWGVEAARKSLEDVARPLSAIKSRLSGEGGGEMPAGARAR
jgi:hypothetical protein